MIIWLRLFSPAVAASSHGAEDIEAEDEEDDDTEHNYDKFMVMLQK